MGFKCGLVGLPNVGKSTLFNALTKAGIAAENYPFCTIEPNVGVVAVPDKRQDKIAAIVKPNRIVPTTMEFVDIAGLVKGASQGEGLGNAFLSHIRETDAIAHMVRCFENDDVIHVAGKVDPLDDVSIINTELLLADLASAEKALQRVQKGLKSGLKEAITQTACVEGLVKHLNDGNPARTYTVDESLKPFFKSLHLLTAKPIMYIANVNEDGFENNPMLDKLRAFAVEDKGIVVPVCAKIEEEIAQLEDEEKRDFLESLGLTEPGLDRVIHSGYQLLGLETYFTAGVQEVRAWTYTKGATAPQGAGIIHSDFERGFIRAEIIAYDDFIQYNGEAGAKEAGKWRLEGKDYVLKDGDVIHFRFNV